MPKLRTDNISWQEVDDEIVCLDLSASRYLLVNSTGSKLWPQLVAGAELDDLAATLTQAFGIDRGSALRDAVAFVDVLDGRGLLEGHAPR